MDARYGQEREGGQREGEREERRAGPWRSIRGFTEAEFDELFTPYFQRHFSIIFFSYFLTLLKVLVIFIARLT